MKKKSLGVILQVKDMDAMRHFYQNVLQVGQLRVDSNVWIEFVLPDGGSLALEWCESPETPTQRCRLLLVTDEIQALRSRFNDHNYHPQERTIEPMGFQILEFHDPEGNIVLVHPVTQENSNS